MLIEEIKKNKFLYANMGGEGNIKAYSAHRKKNWKQQLPIFNQDHHRRARG